MGAIPWLLPAPQWEESTGGRLQCEGGERVKMSQVPGITSLEAGRLLCEGLEGCENCDPRAETA